jgi:hypothetical protein
MCSQRVFVVAQSLAVWKNNYEQVARTIVFCGTAALRRS